MGTANKKYALVAMPVPLRKVFTYRVPDDLDERILPGSAVHVLFARRPMAGIVVERSDRPEDVPESAVRDILDIHALDPVISPRLLELIRWASAYYMEPIGLMARSALPPGLFREKNRFLSVKKTLIDPDGFTEDEKKVLKYLAGKGTARLSRVITGSGAARPRLAAGLLCSKGFLSTSFNEPPESAARRLIAGRSISDETIAEFKRKNPKTSEILDLLIFRGEISVDEVEARFKGAGEKIKKLCEAGLVEIRVDSASSGTTEANKIEEVPDRGFVLSAAQSAALLKISENIGKGYSSFLLHGVTGSGKTEVYMRAAARAKELGFGVLILVPEISLTPQLAQRFRSRFGEDVVVLHSGLGEGDRLKAWMDAESGSKKIVLGTRSAVFAPLKNVGLVVVDEEHDSSFKQEESPRYNGRDLAIKRAQLEGAVVISGSATPSVESYYNTTAGKSALLELPERITGHGLPGITVIDLGDRHAKGEYKKSTDENTDGTDTRPPFFLSKEFMTVLKGTLESGHQAILLINRRGHSTVVMCSQCGHRFQCEHCSVSMTFHKARRMFICHYCGAAVRESAVCPGCGGESLRMLGMGTEKVEDELKRVIPGVRTLRLDRDSVSDFREAERILATFGDGGADVLIGTQMVAKGHHFPNVTLVGIVLADIGLSIPDFRAGERLFSLLTQVSGRSGRGTEAGSVVIQTFNPGHFSIVSAGSHDYGSFYAQEIEERRELTYPPFSRLIRLVFESGDAARTLKMAASFASELGRGRPEDVEILGPAPAVISRMKSSYRYQILIKGGKGLGAVKRKIGTMLDDGMKKRPVGVRVIVDVDPANML